MRKLVVDNGAGNIKAGWADEDSCRYDDTLAPTLEYANVVVVGCSPTLSPAARSMAASSSRTSWNSAETFAAWPSGDRSTAYARGDSMY